MLLRVFCNAFLIVLPMFEDNALGTMEGRRAGKPLHRRFAIMHLPHDCLMLASAMSRPGAEMRGCDQATVGRVAFPSVWDAIRLRFGFPSSRSCDPDQRKESHPSDHTQVTCTGPGMDSTGIDPADPPQRIGRAFPGARENQNPKHCWHSSLSIFRSVPANERGRPEGTNLRQFI